MRMNPPSSELTITFLAAVPYRFHLQGRTQRLAWHMAEGIPGLDVRYVAPPTPRAMVRHWLWPRREHTAGRVKLVWPLPFRPGSRRGGKRESRQARRLNRLLATPGRHILCVSTPLWWPILDDLRADRIVYDCIDAPEVHARRGSGETFRQWHEALCRRADRVVAVSEHLAERLREICTCPVTVCFNGVDAMEFESRSRLEVHEDARETPGLMNWLEWRRHHRQAKVAGFIGSIDAWVDVELIARTARSLRGTRFLVAGPVRKRSMITTLHAEPNITLLDRLPYACVPAVMKTLDVGLIPFRAGEITACADPLKLYEHFALGQPVVATYPFRPEAVSGGLMVVSEGDSYAERVTEALNAPVDPQLAERRRDFARRHDWRLLAERFAELLTFDQLDPDSAR